MRKRNMRMMMLAGLAAAFGLAGCGTLQPSESNSARIQAHTITVNGSQGNALATLMQWAEKVEASPEVVAEIMQNIPAGDFSLITQAINHEAGRDSVNKPSAAYTTPIAIGGDKAIEALQGFSNPTASAIMSAAQQLTGDPKTQAALGKLAEGVQACSDCGISTE